MMHTYICTDWRYANGVYLCAILENIALVQWIRCEPLGEHLVHWTCAVFSHIARKMINVCIFSHDKRTHDIYYHTLCSIYSWSAIWADIDIRLIVKTTAQSVRSDNIFSAKTWNIELMLFNHLQCWSKIKPTLAERFSQTLLDRFSEDSRNIFPVPPFPQKSCNIIPLSQRLPVNPKGQGPQVKLLISSVQSASFWHGLSSHSRSAATQNIHQIIMLKICHS